MHALIKHPLFDCDVEEASHWYALKDPALADRFIDAVEFAMRKAAQRPFQFSTKLFGARKARIKSFPYGIYFIVGESSVFLSALIHDSQDAESILRQRNVPKL